MPRDDANCHRRRDDDRHGRARPLNEPSPSCRNELVRRRSQVARSISNYYRPGAPGNSIGAIISAQHNAVAVPGGRSSIGTLPCPNPSRSTAAGRHGRIAGMPSRSRIHPPIPSSYCTCRDPPATGRTINVAAAAAAQHVRAGVTASWSDRSRRCMRAPTDMAGQLTDPSCPRAAMTGAVDTGGMGGLFDLALHGWWREATADAREDACACVLVLLASSLSRGGQAPTGQAKACLVRCRCSLCSG